MRYTFLSMISSIMSFSPLVMADTAATQPATSEAQATYQDIERTLGLTPKFIRQIPKETLSGAWHEVKHVVFSDNTAIPGKYKQLIALGVAAQVPSSHLVEFDTKVSGARGAKNAEIQEAIAIAGLTRHWSTLLNGAMIDEGEFRKEVDSLLQYLKDRPVHRASSAPALTNTRQAYDDINATLGQVPKFLRLGSEAGLVGLWKQMKEMELSADTAIPSRYKELIGLAVAAQIPCRYCAYFHTKAAEMQGATDDEIREALTIAAIERQWATMFSGMQVNQASFSKEVDQMIEHMKKSRTGNRPTTDAT